MHGGRNFNDNTLGSDSSMLNKSKLVSTILTKRGIDTEDKIEKFINPKLSDFNNPFDFENMEKIVAKIIEMKNSRSKIFIYGDYDVDGISGCSFLVRFFRDIGINVDYYIPNRSEEGYGLSKKNIDFMKQKKAKLIITVDVGVNSIEDVEYARSLGIEVIVTDHHKSVKEEIEDKILYLNPRLSDNYKFKYLSGAGVAFKLGQGLCSALGLSYETVYKYLDIVMLGTIADVVPMLGENRIIIKYGLEILKNTNVKGLFYLLRYLKLQNKTINTTDVSYFISPLVNSLGRVGISKVGVDFLVKNDDFIIYNIIEEMKTLNKQRRQLEKLIYDDAINEISTMDLKNLEMIFLSSDKWHPGVIGVVSSRLCSKFDVPVVLIAYEGKFGKASCRSIPSVNIFNMIEKSSDLLVRFGGHDLAAGFVLDKGNEEKLKQSLLNNLVYSDIDKDKDISTYDLELKIEDIDEEILKELELLSPFGVKNPYPLFIDRNIEFKEIKKFGVDKRHFNAIIKKNNKLYNSVGFELAYKIDEELYMEQKFDIIYYPEKIIFRGEETVQIRIKDLKIKNF